MKPYQKPQIKATLKNEGGWYCQQCTIARFDLVVRPSSLNQHIREHLKDNEAKQ